MKCRGATHLDYSFFRGVPSKDPALLGLAIQFTSAAGTAVHSDVCL